MASLISQELTNRFYAWEQRGRGWHVCDSYIDPEPIFFPFFGHYLPPQRIQDDGVQLSLLSSIAGLFKKKVEEEPEPYNDLYDIPPVEGHYLYCNEPIETFAIVLPKGEKMEVEDICQLLIMLSYTTYPVSFEIVATASTITLQFACRTSDAAHVYEQAKAYFPNAVITKS